MKSANITEVSVFWPGVNSMPPQAETPSVPKAHHSASPSPTASGKHKLSDAFSINPCKHKRNKTHHDLSNIIHEQKCLITGQSNDVTDIFFVPRNTPLHVVSQCSTFNLRLPLFYIRMLLYSFTN
jgi:hypothetical protein